MPGYSKKQMKIAKVAEPRDKITGQDFKVLRANDARKRMKNMKA
tara:strand:+ start:376 stop:507 length:132 start_codon:yes stop_codon:yes gene_type:complete